MSCFVTLKDNGFRLTQPRRVILNYIHDTPGHLTAEQIITHVQDELPHINKSTVYRTLDLLENNGCVFKSESSRGIVYHHAEEGHHHHAVCSRCGKAISCQTNVFAPVARLLREEYGFRAHFQHVIIAGLCAECQNPDA